jgi:hypothetical protein
VQNAAWVWCPTANGFADGQAAAFYPGNNEVDWICADAYPAAWPSANPFAVGHHTQAAFCTPAAANIARM